jgi:hypothetical protein
MAWFKIDDNFIMSKKVLMIPRDDRAIAIGFWTMAGVWSAHERTDGVVPDYVLADLNCPDSVIDDLVKAGLWIKNDDSIVFHDWCEYQPTREQLEAKAAEVSAKRSAAGSKGAASRWQNDGKRMANDSPEPEPEPEPKKTNTKNSDAENKFEEFWSVYPRRQGKGKARESWIRAVKSNDPVLIIDAARAYSHSPLLPVEIAFIPLPQTWLNQERWLDDIAIAIKTPQTKLGSDASLYCKLHGYPKTECFKCDPDYQDV